MAEELRVPIGIPVETNASVAADDIVGLRDSIAKSTDKIKEHALFMRNLKGDTKELVDARAELKTKMDRERDSISKHSISLMKQGVTFKDNAKEAKKSEDIKTKAVKENANAVAESLRAAGGPVTSLKDKLGALGETAGGGSSAMTALAGVAALAAAAIVAVGAAAYSAAVSVGKFILVSADAERMMQLTRKANLNGNDEWARNLGDQVDAIARKVPVARDKLNELGISLAKSRIGGQTMVDTMAAVAGATSAAGDDLGSKLKGIVERGAFTKRFQLSPQEMLGMDLDFDDVAKAYAEGMHVSVARAREELVSGRVKLSQGAAALKTAVDAKFGAINADKLLSFDNQMSRFKNNLVGLTKDVDLTKLLKGMSSLGDNFDQTSVNGKALRGIVTSIGNAIGVTFDDGVPVLQNFIDKAVYGALKIENYWLRAKIAFAGLGTGASLEFTLFKTALAGLGGLLRAFPGVSVFVDAFNLVSLVVGTASRGLDALKNSLVFANDSLLGIDWAKTGSHIIDGLVGGLTSGTLKVVDKVKQLAGAIKGAFTSELKIQSPSKVFAEYGKQTAAGAEKGVESGTPGVLAATSSMAQGMRGEGASAGASGGGSSGGRGGGSVQITFAPQIQVQGGGGDVGQQLKDPALLQALTDAFLAMIRAAGIEVPA